MKLIRIPDTIALALLLGTAPVAIAQKTYRCGNTYQSIPCTISDGKSGTIKTTDSGTAQKPPALDASGKPIKPETPSRSTTAVSTTSAAAAAPQLTGEEKKLAAAKQAEADAEKKKAAVAAEKKARCDKIKNDINYNTSQLRAGGSNITQDRLNAERRQLNTSLSSEGC